MKTQKMYRYNKPSAEKGKKAPLILCQANNEAHAMMLFRERFKDEEGNYEFIDKALIEEYIEKPKPPVNKNKKKSDYKKKNKEDKK